MLTAAKHFEVREFPIPQPGDDEILVKVEGCGVCGTDVHEWKGDPFGYIPLVLGHEGTGEVVALGKNIKHDSQGHPIRVGDKLVTSCRSRIPMLSRRTLWLTAPYLCWLLYAAALNRAVAALN